MYTRKTELIKAQGIIPSDVGLLDIVLDQENNTWKDLDFYYKLKENNGKGEIVTKDGSASFTLSPIGLEKLKKQNKKEVKAIEVKRKQK